MALYQQESEVLSLVFNATGSDNENWFSKNRLIQSPWTDLESEQQNYFSLIGDLSSERSFYINKVKKHSYRLKSKNKTLAYALERKDIVVQNNQHFRVFSRTALCSTVNNTTEKCLVAFFRIVT